jgi:hypothetical protein
LAGAIEWMMFDQSSVSKAQFAAAIAPSAA